MAESKKKSKRNNSEERGSEKELKKVKVISESEKIEFFKTNEVKLSNLNGEKGVVGCGIESILLKIINFIFYFIMNFCHFVILSFFQPIFYSIFSHFLLNFYSFFNQFFTQFSTNFQLFLC